MKMVGSWIFLLISLQGYEAPSTPNVNCLIINLDYVKCTWSAQGSPEVNSIFFHNSFIKGNMEECTSYLQENGSEGCSLSYNKSDRFKTLTTKLVHQNKSYVQNHNLKSMVKLYPPANLSVEMNKDPELNLYWDNSKTSICIESEVRYRINNNKWQTSTPIREQSYAVPFPLKSSQYEFQVRARVNSVCGESQFWSEWSQPFLWDSMKGNNTTDVNCLIINLDYVKCTWSAQGSPEVNSIFFHNSFIKGNMEECTSYLQENGSEGCSLSYDKSDRFKTLTTKLVHQNKSYVQNHNLKSMALPSCQPLSSVEMNKDPELNLYWDNSKTSICIESEVRYRINNNKWQTSTPIREQSYAVPFPLKSNQYEFQVRARVNSVCGESQFWSEWSQPFLWDSMKGNNTTDQ